jgi:hypothetical protein
MRVDINVTESFKKAARPLIRRYRSFLEDLICLETDLRGNPKLGQALGGNVYKIRLRIRSKGKGKSGGARVISFVELFAEVNEDDSTVVNLLTVYDKKDKSDISNDELRKLISALRSTTE